MKKSQIKNCLVNCPLCSGRQKETLYSDLTDVENGIWGLYTISRCLSCGLVYLSKKPTHNSFPHLYPQDYHARIENREAVLPRILYEQKYGFEFRRLRKILDHIPASLVDIGCGSGGLLMELKRHWGGRCRLAGVELAAPTTIDLAKNGIKMFIGKIEDLKAPQQFEIVTMYSVLEHVYNPVAVLKTSKKWLIGDGILIGEVPDFDSPWRDVFSKYWGGMQIPRHMTFFTRATLKSVMEKAGFKLLSARSIYDPGDLAVSLNNFLISHLSPRTRPRQSWAYLPLMILTAPISLIMTKVLKFPCTLLFTARMKK